MLALFAVTLFASATSPLLRRTHVRQNAPAVAGRHARRLEHLHGVLPSGAAGGLRLRAFHLAPVAPQTDHFARPHRSIRTGLLAHRHRGEVASADRKQPDSRGLPVTDSYRRPAVLCDFGQRAAFAALVFAQRPCGGARPIFPVRCQQHRQHFGAAKLSLFRRTLLRSADSKPLVDHRLCWPGVLLAVCGWAVARNNLQ